MQCLSSGNTSACPAFKITSSSEGYTVSSCPSRRPAARGRKELPGQRRVEVGLGRKSGANGFVDGGYELSARF